jgi:sigma-E factor negative regulatory protein RseB
MTTRNEARRPGIAPGLMLTLALVAGATGADTGNRGEAEALLRHATEAATGLNYDGVFIYRSGEWMETMRIIHRAGPGGSKARLVSLSGEAREVIREANRVTCILPDSGAVLVSKSKPRAVTGLGVFNPQGAYLDHYDLGLHEGERVAGRGTRRVTVMPRDGYRYGYRLWVDVDSGFLLKSELVDGSGHALEQIVYTSLTLPEKIPDHDLRPAVSGEGFTWYTSDAPHEPKRASDWRVDWLPDGFAMRDRATDPAGLGRMPAEHLVYTDGLASVSVFIEHLDAGGERLEGLSHMGAVNAFGVMVDGFQVTAVGEVPAATVEAIGRAVSRR